jgi:hypothetical protein
MIRTILASPWLPLMYWTSAVIALICGLHRRSLRGRLSHYEFQSVVLASSPSPVPIHDRSLTPIANLTKPPNMAVYRPTHFWYLQTAIPRAPEFSNQGFERKMTTNSTPISKKPLMGTVAPVTMLSIRVDSSKQETANSLEIQCRTSVRLSNTPARTVTIQGVVTQEVVSSKGKILIMAGSRVVGPGLLDPENGRFKSDGLWSIFFDDTELKVRARLLDRSAGLPGLLGQETSNDEESLPRKTLLRDGRSIFVPRNAPFVLEVHGEIELRDLPAPAASN